MISKILVRPAEMYKLKASQGNKLSRQVAIPPV